MLSVLIYRLAIGLYAIAVRIASLFSKKAQLFVAGRRKLLSHIRYSLIDERRPRIWMHCASLGEFEQGRPVLERLRKEYPAHAFVLTFFSPSGYEIRKDYPGADHVFYLPIDTPANARKFLDLVQPKLCVFVKYDFWYFLLRQIAARDLPLILVSAIFRKEQPFFQWYGSLHRRMLFFFSKIFVQDEGSAQLLQKVGVDDAVVAGDTRFDRVAEAVSAPKVLPEIKTFAAGAKILIAGSSWPEDERFLQKVLAELSSEWKLIVVPHEVNESHIHDLEKLFGNESVKWSALKDHSDARVLIVDSIGLLLHLYRYATIAWIGGGFGRGIHNTLEAAVYGLPVFFGPNFQKFREAKGLIATGAAFSTAEPSYLVNAIRNWDADDAALQRASAAAQRYVLSNAGATARVIAYLSEKKVLSAS
jgi:3-deoxy-D-manno-octulosonic-acid transferase